MIDSFVNRNANNDPKIRNTMPLISVKQNNNRIYLSKKSRLVRKKIEILDYKMTLPSARTTLGLLEGEHSSRARYGNGDIVDIHQWQPGDEARMMNWSASARVGQPMVCARERLIASSTWIICDASISMNSSCKSGEYAYEVAANAICLFASLSMKRNDTVKLVMSDGDCVKQMPEVSNMPDCERIIDTSLLKFRHNSKNIDSILDFIRNIRSQNDLIVLIANSEMFSSSKLDELQEIIFKHKLIVVSINTINSCDSSLKSQIFDGITLRQIPAFLMEDTIKKEIDSRRSSTLNLLDEKITNMSASIIHADSSESMLREAFKTMSRKVLQ